MNNYTAAHLRYNTEQARLIRMVSSAPYLTNSFHCGTEIYDHVACGWNVTELLGVTASDAKPGTDLALDSAREHFNICPGDTICLFYPAGIYNDRCSNRRTGVRADTEQGGFQAECHSFSLR